jgi:hypothetical protein
VIYKYFAFSDAIRGSPLISGGFFIRYHLPNQEHNVRTLKILTAVVLALAVAALAYDWNQKRQLLAVYNATKDIEDATATLKELNINQLNEQVAISRKLINTMEALVAVRDEQLEKLRWEMRTKP